MCGSRSMWVHKLSAIDWPQAPQSRLERSDKAKCVARIEDKSEVDGSERGIPRPDGSSVTIAERGLSKNSRRCQIMAVALKRRRAPVAEVPEAAWVAAEHCPVAGRPGWLGSMHAMPAQRHLSPAHAGRFQPAAILLRSTRRLSLSR